jgi:hypothetical protein
VDGFTLMKLTGEAADIMIQVCDSYRKFVQYEDGKAVIYLRLKKALYGSVRSVLLCYELFANMLKDMAFELNPYDVCVSNININGSQCTIIGFIDDNKISHIDPAVVSDIIEKIEERFGKMTVMRGRNHVFWGWSAVTMTMIQCLHP